MRRIVGGAVFQDEPIFGGLEAKQRRSLGLFVGFDLQLRVLAVQQEIAPGADRRSRWCIVIYCG